MTPTVRTVVGVPVREGGTHFRHALDSLLRQDAGDVALVVVDDSDSDEVETLARQSGVHYRRNERRLGLVANWRRAYAVARELHPRLEFFAWGSDHDVWEPGWLRALRTELERAPEAVLAYPLNDVVAEDGAVLAAPWRFETRGERRPAVRLARTTRRMVAGDMVYGLFRAAALERCGVFRDVLMPDRLLLAELALAGEFHQVPELLWHRRFRGGESVVRQRAARAGRVPWPLQHARFLGAWGPAYAAMSVSFAAARAVMRVPHRF